MMSSKRASQLMSTKDHLLVLILLSLLIFVRWINHGQPSKTFVFAMCFGDFHIWCRSAHDKKGYQQINNCWSTKHHKSIKCHPQIYEKINIIVYLSCYRFGTDLGSDFGSIFANLASSWPQVGPKLVPNCLSGSDHFVQGTMLASS